MLGRTKLLYQLADRLFAVGDRSQSADLAIRLGYRYSNRFGMDIQSQKSYLFLHDRFLSAYGSELCFCPESQPNPRSAHWAGHAILTRRRCENSLGRGKTRSLLDPCNNALFSRDLRHLLSALHLI